MTDLSNDELAERLRELADHIRGHMPVSAMSCIEAATRLSAQPAKVEAVEGERGAAEIMAERRRQVEAEGWTPEHDDEHVNGEMALAAACYAHEAARSPYSLHHVWPWSSDWFKRADKRRMLIKAGALIIAEIERLDRAARATTAETEAASLRERVKALEEALAVERILNMMDAEALAAVSPEEAALSPEEIADAIRIGEAAIRANLEEKPHD